MVRTVVIRESRISNDVGESVYTELSFLLHTQLYDTQVTVPEELQMFLSTNLSEFVFIRFFILMLLCCAKVIGRCFQVFKVKRKHQ